MGPGLGIPPQATPGYLHPASFSRARKNKKRMARRFARHTFSILMWPCTARFGEPATGFRRGRAWSFAGQLATKQWIAATDQTPNRHNGTQLLTTGAVERGFLESAIILLARAKFSGIMDPPAGVS